MGIFDFMRKKDKGGSSQSSPSSSDFPSPGDTSLQGAGMQGFQNDYGMPGADPNQPFGQGFGQDQGAQQSPFSQGFDQGNEDPFSQQSYDSYSSSMNQGPGGYSQSDSDDGRIPPPVDGMSQQQDNQSQSSSRENEMVLAKLDAIRTAIQNLDHRLSVIENKIDSGKSKSGRDIDNVF